MNYGISTSWKTTELKDSAEILSRIDDTGITGLELDYRITKEMFDKMKPMILSGKYKVLSLHNYFPKPEIINSPTQASNEPFMSSLDAQEREFAIKYAIRTIQNASEMGASAIVCHIGEVTYPSNRNDEKKLYALCDENKTHTNEGKCVLKECLQQRERHKVAYIDAVLKCLDKIHEVAFLEKIYIGVENRYHFYEIPDIDEMDMLLSEFSGGNIGYWHDCGHAQVNEHLGIVKHESYLQRFSKNLIGMHLHDCMGFDDHIAPGDGEIDFDMIKRYIPENAIKILEVHDQVSLEQLIMGVNFLTEKGIIYP